MAVMYHHVGRPRRVRPHLHHYSRRRQHPEEFREVLLRGPKLAFSQFLPLQAQDAEAATLVKFTPTVRRSRLGPHMSSCRPSASLACPGPLRAFGSDLPPVPPSLLWHPIEPAYATFPRSRLDHCSSENCSHRLEP